MKKIKHFIVTRKTLSIIIIIIIAIAAYYIYTKYTTVATQTSYIVGRTRIGNVATTISGTGQVYASSQLDIKSKASGELTFLNTAKNGQQIKKGELIAQVNTRDVSISLGNAKIAYAKLVEPADNATMLQSENNLVDAIQNNSKSYSDSFTTITDTYVNLPTVMSAIDNMLYSRTGFLQSENVRFVGQTALDLQNKTGISYDIAKTHYTELLLQYKNISNSSATSTIEGFVLSTYAFAKEVAAVVKNAQNAVDFIVSQRADTAGTNAQSSIASWTNTITSDVTNLLTAKNTITNSLLNINQQKLNLEKTVKGATNLDIASQKLQLQQAQNNYDDYFVKAPFDGVLARLSVKPTDSVSNGTVIGTLVSAQRTITITLNEIDVAKVKVAQKAKITFDAINGLISDGTVTIVDLVGTVSQGVVNYNVEIALDNADERIRSGMSASASIITDFRENVLTVPNSAVKTQKGLKGAVTYYIEEFNPPLEMMRNNTYSSTTVSATSKPATLPGSGIVSNTLPIKKTVEMGLVDDNNTEIISGLIEGEQIVIKTMAGTATAAKAGTASAITTPRTGINANRGNAGFLGGAPH